MTGMIDMKDEDVIHLPKEEFVALAEAILAARGVDKFADDWIEIRRNYNGLDLEITRQKQQVDENHRRSHLRVSNPTTMVMKGEIIRHHGEHAYLVTHMRGLLENAND